MKDAEAKEKTKNEYRPSPAAPPPLSPELIARFATSSATNMR